MSTVGCRVSFGGRMLQYMWSPWMINTTWFHWTSPPPLPSFFTLSKPQSYQTLDTTFILMYIKVVSSINRCVWYTPVELGATVIINIICWILHCLRSASTNNAPIRRLFLAVQITNSHLSIDDFCVYYVNPYRLLLLLMLLT